MAVKITFIGFGEASGILAADLAKDDHVTIWDCKLNGKERDTMLVKPRHTGVRTATSFA